VELSERAAHLLDEKLGEPDAAIPFLQRVLARRPDDATSFARLKQLFTARERWRDLEALYEAGIAAASGDAQRVELLHELALVADEITGEPARAIASYERILEIDPTHAEAGRALDGLYTREQRWASLATLLAARLDRGDDPEAGAVALRLARLELDSLDRPEEAQKFYREALSEFPSTTATNDHEFLRVTAKLKP
jgi:tetratricopeptide (TPR) repeat protein